MTTGALIGQDPCCNVISADMMLVLHLLLVVVELLLVGLPGVFSLDRRLLRHGVRRSRIVVQQLIVIVVHGLLLVIVLGAGARKSQMPRWNND